MANIPLKIDGEQGFVGFNSRENPTVLRPGFARYAQNFRFDRGEGTVRLGLKDLTVADIVNSSVNILTSCEYTTASGDSKIVLVVGDGLFLYDTQTKLTSSKINFPTGRTISATDPVDCFQAENKIYILRGYSRNAEISQNGVAGCVSRTVNTVTITCTNPHGYATGDEVIIYVPGHLSASGSYIITVTSPTVFTYTTTASGSINHNQFTCVEAKAPLVFDGSTVSVVEQANATQYPYLQNGDSVCMPPADFGLYFQGRIVLCVSRDEIAASNYYEPNVFDVSLDQFKINSGDNDYITGFVPYQDNSFLIFKRNSIYYAFLPPPAITSVAIDRGIDTNSSISTLTNQFGCSARRTIQVAGQNIFFLSDRGIYQLNTALDLKLVGDQLPLSDSINDLIEKINTNYASKSCGLFFNNRYYISVPIDDVELQASIKNNCVLVYSLVNKAWESIDTYPIEFTPKVFIQATYENRRQMFAICDKSLFLCEANSTDIVNNGLGTPILNVAILNTDVGTTSARFTVGSRSQNINARLISRRYTFASLDQKRFSGLQVDSVLDSSTQIDISAISYNPDQQTNLISVSSFAEEEKSIRAKIAHRAYALDIKFQVNSGRPTIRGLTVDGVISGRNFVSSE